MTFTLLVLMVLPYVVFQPHIMHPTFLRPHDADLIVPASSKAKTHSDFIQLQRDFCAHPNQHYVESSENKTKLARAKWAGSEFDMYVHSSGDVVSDFIQATGSWEPSETQDLYSTIERYVQKKGIKDRSKLTVLDIGAEVGWYSLGMAHKGYRVFAFEPMKDNWYMLRKSMCKNPSFNITLVSAGLGTRENTCTLYVERVNTGNSHMYCGDGNAPGGYFYAVDTATVYRLDSFADFMGDLVAIKMDVEGSEDNVLRGGRKVLLEKRVPFIMTEFSIRMIEEKGGDPWKYLLEFEEAGYRFSLDLFDREYLTADEVMQLAHDNIINLMLTHKSVQL